MLPLAGPVRIGSPRSNLHLTNRRWTPFHIAGSALGLLAILVILLKFPSVLTPGIIASSSLLTSLGLVHSPLPHELLVRTKSYSIIVSTYDRFEHLTYFLNHYGNANLPNLHAIFIAWGLGGVDPPESLVLDEYRIPVYLVRATKNSLTERFRVPANMKTDAALWIDDDIIIQADSVEFMFRAWRDYGAAQHRIVGLTGRELTNDKHGRLKYTFHKLSYSMVLTNNAFMDKTMANWFWESDKANRQAIAYVDQHLNCEDIMMNYVVTRKTGLPPILVNIGDDAVTLNSHGISKKPGHTHQRSLCTQLFTSLYGPILLSTNTAISPAPEDTREFVDIPDAWKPTGKSWGSSKFFVKPQLDSS